ncbi:MAG: hypothetical protein WC520_04355 [Candidatus Paceibacterota bacterium]
MAKKRKIKTSAVLFTLLGILAGFYIFQIIQLTQSGYQIEIQQKQITALKKETAGLKLSLSSNRNLGNFENRIKEQGYNKVDKIDYLVIPSDAIASTK